MAESVISTLRHNLGLNQKELALKCGVTQQHIHLIESGKKSPSLRVAAKIAAALGCTIEDLIGRNDGKAAG